MPTLTVTEHHIDVRFSLGERIGGLIWNQRIPLASVRSIEVVDDPIAATRGWRAPGLGIPGIRKIGHWRGPVGHELVCIRRGEPAIRIRLDHQRYDSLLLGVTDAKAMAQEIEERIR